MNIETVKPEYRELILNAETEIVDLRGANLRHADLSHADLSGADLSHADLSGADLRHADLRHADLRHADLRGSNLKVYQAGIWTAYITPSHIGIGCKLFSVDEWKKFSDSEIDKMSCSALTYWKENKAIVLSIAESFDKQEKKVS